MNLQIQRVKLLRTNVHITKCRQSSIIKTEDAKLAGDYINLIHMHNLKRELGGSHFINILSLIHLRNSAAISDQCIEPKSVLSAIRKFLVSRSVL